MRQPAGIPPDEEWRDRLAMRFMTIALHNPEPNEWFNEWAAAAVDYFNDSHMFYAYKLWHELRDMSGVELQMHLDQVARISSEPNDPTDDIPF